MTIRLNKFWLSILVITQFHGETADEWYEALARYKQQMEESGFGKEYWKSFNLPSKESLWGEDMHLDFGEVVFTIQTTDGRVIQSQRMTGEIVEGTQ